MADGWQKTQSLIYLAQAEFEEDLCLVARSWGGFGLWHLMKSYSGQIHLVVQLAYDCFQCINKRADGRTDRRM